MKVILLQEVKGKGSEGDVVEVARGYAANYLLPRKIAVEATPGNLKQLEARRRNIEKRETARRGTAQSAADAVAGRTVRIAAKVGDEGRLYGSVTGQMIADAIVEQLAVDADKRRIDVHGHIKTVGDHVVTVRFHKDVTAELTVSVVGEDAPAAPAEPSVADILAAEESSAEAATVPETGEPEAEETGEP